MSIPLPNLDNRRFQALVEDATKLIPRHAPDWTDHNRHDPGITLIELFAWLEEMLEFYLNQVRDESYWKFLKLLGVVRRDATPAAADISFALSGTTVATRVPPGSKLRAGAAVFETGEEITVTRAALRAIGSASATGIKDNTEANSREGLTYPAFGSEAEAGSRLYLGFEDLDQAAAFPFSLTVRMQENYPVARGEHGDEPPVVIPSALVTWEYSNAAGQWMPLDPIAELERIFALFPQIAENRPLCVGLRARIRAAIEASTLAVKMPALLLERIRDAQAGGDLTRLLTDPEVLLALGDETLMFSRSGRIFFTLPADLGRKRLDPFPVQYYWLRATIKAAGFELAPRLESIRMHTLPVVQGETISEVRTFSISAALSYQFPASYLEQNGESFVQIEEQPGLWTDWEQRPDLTGSSPTDRHFTLSRASGAVTVQFGDNTHGRTPPPGENNARLVSHLNGARPSLLIGASKGLPDLEVSLPRTPAVAKRLLLQVMESPTAWADYQVVADFDAASPTQRSFVLDPDSGRVRFGDGNSGTVPPALESRAKNVRVISYAIGGGPQGNVEGETIRELSGPALPVTVLNPAAASGGAAGETLEDAMRRARAHLRIRYRAVTSPDFVTVSKATPGLRVARAHPLPLFEPGLQNYPTNLKQATVTVVVVPYSESEKPVPSRGFLQTVCRHLMKHRLITTRIRVIGPEYTCIGVDATLTLRPGFTEPETRARVDRAIRDFFHPLSGGPEGEGWPFGRTVYKSEVYEVLERVDGVGCVERLRLIPSGASATRDAAGNIALPPRGLTCVSTIQIGFISSGDACRGKAKVC